MAVQRIPILMYHSISRESSAQFRPFIVTPESFDAQLSYLHQHGCQTLTISQFIQARTQGEKTLPERLALLTFDDGFADFYSTVLPLLKRYGFVATLYVTTGFIGSTSRWLASSGESSRPLLNWDQISEIAASGIECGAHTVTHPTLDAIPHGVARDEIKNSKRALEDHLHREINSFAYPFGYYSRATIQLVQEAGFSSACAVRYAMSSIRDDAFALARHIVRYDTRLEEFASLLNGQVPVLPLMYNRLRATGWRIIRQSAQRLKA